MDRNDKTLAVLQLIRNMGPRMGLFPEFNKAQNMPPGMLYMGSASGFNANNCSDIILARTLLDKKLPDNATEELKALFSLLADIGSTCKEATNGT